MKPARTSVLSPAPTHYLVLALSLMLISPSSNALGDAIIVTRAMQAPTIAEIFVQSGGVRVELEISSRSLDAFADLLPDSLRAALEMPARARWNLPGRQCGRWLPGDF